MLFETKREYTIFIRILTVAIIATSAFGVLYSKIDSLANIIYDVCEYPEIIELMLKGVAACLITSISSEICAESGNTAIAKAVEFFGRILIVVLAYPLIVSVIKTAIAFAGG